MKGIHKVLVQNRRIQYKFQLERNITILHGDSATGKTTLIDMLASYQRNGLSSGITVSCDKPCVVLTSVRWQSNLAEIKDSIVFIDEGDKFVLTREFAEAAKNSDNYYVIATRSSLFNLPYSVTEIYGIKNTSGNRYQGTKRLYSNFYRLYPANGSKITRPDLVVVEDSNSGCEFFQAAFEKYGVPCQAAKGKSNIYRKLLEAPAETILVVADGAAFGPEIERVLSLAKAKRVTLYLPESFEWIVLKSGLIAGVEDILEKTPDYVESEKYFSWERFFTDLLIDRTRDRYLRYSKNKLNPVYLQEHEKTKILAVIPEVVP